MIGGGDKRLCVKPREVDDAGVEHELRRAGKMLDLKRTMIGADQRLVKTARDLNCTVS